jgi:hypothetical protein
MKNLLYSCVILALVPTPLLAADHSMDSVGGSGSMKSSSVNWAMRFGLAFDGYYVDQADNDEGTEDSDWNIGGHIDWAWAIEGDNGLGVQTDIRGSQFDRGDDDNDDDWTRNYLTGGLHLYHRTATGLYGAFAGTGIHDDSGDTDDEQTYWFFGAEGQWQVNNAIVFGQAGYLDADDEYEEGLNEAGFARLGGRVFKKQNLALMAAVSGAFGQQDSDDAYLANLELEAEHAFGSGSTSLFSSYEGTFVSFDSGDHNTNFHSVMVGFRWRPGADDLMSVYSGPASLELPSVDRCVAYSANEIE